jgi:choline kinase
MKALILNSGRGTRMGALTGMRPKCLCPIGGGHTILSRQLAQLVQAGIREAVITVGPFAKMLKAHVQALSLPLYVTYVPNPLYRRTNYIYSMHLAAPHLGEDMLLLHGDLVLDTGVLAELAAGGGSAVAVDAGLPQPEKDFKARVEGGRVLEIGVNLFGENCVACQPAYFWRRGDLARWLEEIGAFCREGRVGVYAEDAFNARAGEIFLRPLELGGRLCREVDTPADLAEVIRFFEKDPRGAYVGKKEAGLV